MRFKSLALAVLTWAAASGNALAASNPYEQSAMSVRQEAAALFNLVAVIKAEVRSGRLDLTTRAKLAWQDCVAAWESVEQRGQVGDWKTAYLATSQARLACQFGADEVFSVQASEPIKLAVKAYVDAVEPRLAACRELILTAKDESLEKRWWLARGSFEESKKLAAVSNYERAWDGLVSSAGKIDRLILEALWGYKDEEQEEAR